MKKKVNRTKNNVNKEKNKIDNVGSFDTDISKVIYIIIGVVFVFCVFYLITLFVFDKDTEISKSDEEIFISLDSKKLHI